MNDWRKPCEHGQYAYHVDAECKHGKTHMHASSEWACAGPESCPGGSPVTAADLEGEKVWHCLWEGEFNPDDCAQYNHKGCGWRLLIPIPEQVVSDA